MVIMAVRFLTTLLTISTVLGTGRALSCYECEGIVVSLNDKVMDVEETGLDSDGNCEQITCENGMDTCQTGTYKMSANYKPTGSVWMPMERNIVYQKGCGVKIAATCDAIKAALASAPASDESGEVKDMEVSACEVESCDTDNCNTKTPKEINSAYSEPISCYTCFAKDLSADDPLGYEIAAQECTDDNKKTCPFGVTQCVYGNIEVKVEMVGLSTTQQIEYLKGCGGSMFSDCDVLELMATAAAAELSGGTFDIDCNIGSCSGGLCNNQTVEEVKAYSGSSAVQSAIILLTASILYLIG